jgi:hypothetical protein
MVRVATEGDVTELEALIDRSVRSLSASVYAAELMATLPGVPLYRALGFVDIEAVDVPMPGGLVLPCIRMGRSL